MEYVLLLVGFVLLIKGADFFVEGSSSLARILRIPSVIIGLTIVAMGTSAPEASVSINAALAGSNDIAISNVVGSNIFNGLVVVGVCAVLAAFQTNKDILKRDMPLNICVSAILCLMFLDGKLSRTEGILLLAGMVLYLCFMIRSALKNREPGADIQTLSLPVSLLYIVGGLAAVIIGQVLFGKLRGNFAFTLLTVVFGAIIYYLVLQVVLWMGLNSNDLKLLSALVVAVFLAIPYMKGKYFSKSAKRGN